MEERELLARVAAFEDASLPVAAWNHAAHLVAALVYVRRYGRGGSYVLLGNALRRYIGAVGGQPSAFHETVTRAWIDVVAAFDAERPDAPLTDAAEALVARCSGKDYLHRYYSPEVLASEEARARWVEPDRTPIG